MVITGRVRTPASLLLLAVALQGMLSIPAAADSSPSCTPWREPAQSSGSGVSDLLKGLPLTMTWAGLPDNVKQQLQTHADNRLAAYRAHWGAAALSSKETDHFRYPTLETHVAVNDNFQNSYEAALSSALSHKNFSRALVCTDVAYKNERVTVRLDEKSPAFHFPVGNRIVHIEPAFEDYSFMLFDICDAMEMSKDECTIFPMNGNLGGNAIATILDGNRIIIYDRKLSPVIGFTGAVAVIAHELGHHFCGHLGYAASPDQEIVADRFAGAALRNSGVPLDQALSVAEIFSERPSRSHPEKSDRVAAITNGWTNPVAARNCR